ncbi:MAG: raffinose/stachyose/melibiose transport system substrate-binding protein [Gaiellaceae bacterium]|jgi:raffinose/stachyose/melibiose transport system substrate-binding protein|nr:raffinose/stachyose/melibiose transport system substrate-binding protein [Gaiellaceae bacterium]
MASAGFRVMVVAASAVVALSVAVASNARPAARGDTVTISMMALYSAQPGLDVVIANFERVYPQIKVSATYAGSVVDIYQLETTQLRAGSAPDILYLQAGCGSPVAICTLARSGYLAPLLAKRWVRWSLPLLTSADKYGKGLYGFTATVAVYGIFTNDDLFRKHGLKIPSTFPQLLDLCRRSRTAGTTAYLFPGAAAQAASNLIATLAVADVDKRFDQKHRAGNVSFESTAGWRQALQQVIDMNDAGCFQAGASGASNQSVLAQFAQGQALMAGALTSNQGLIDAASPQFRYTFHPFPTGSDVAKTMIALTAPATLGINAHASSEAQKAAQRFVDFMARPKQGVLFARETGAMTQQQFLTRQIPAYMSSDFASVLAQRRYRVTPLQTWWNANVLLALQQNQIGLITGQRSIDDVLKAMDAAWAQGPA